MALVNACLAICLGVVSDVCVLKCYLCAVISTGSVNGLMSVATYTLKNASKNLN